MRMCTVLVGGAVFRPTALPLDATGRFRLSSTLPPSTPPGTTSDFQWIGLDTGGPNATFSASNGLKMVVM